MPATTVLETNDLGQAVNDKARKIRPPRGTQAIVPLKFDTDGEVVSEETPSAKLILKRLSLRDLRFLSVWRELGFDSPIETVAAKALVDVGTAERLIKKLACFREEDAKVKALAEIPTTSWVTAKHVENVYEGGRLSDSEHKSLQELAKIQGAYKNQTNVQINHQISLTMPQLSAEQAEAAKKFFDTVAIQESNAA